MAAYYVNDNAEDTGEHEVHEDGCFRMPLPKNRTYLGEFKDCHGAVKKAKDYYKKVDGCKHCSEPCHTR